MSDMATLPAAKSRAETDLRNLAKVAALLAILAVATIAVGLLTGLDALVLIEPFARAVNTLDFALFFETLLRLLGKFAPLVPTSFYLLAVLGAAGILDHIGKGEYFSPRNIRALGDMGGSMLWGAAWAAFLTPAIADWMAGRFGYTFELEADTIVIAIIGLAILVIGRLFLRAQKLEADMESIL